MDDRDYAMLKMHAHMLGQRQADGAAAYAENLRYAYLTGKDRISFAEAQGIRHVVESGSGRTRAESNHPAATSANAT